MTFNDEVACRKKIGVDVTGAVQATSLLAILEKLDDPFLRVFENEKGELEFKGKRKSFGVTKDAEIFLPIDKVETPTEWYPLQKKFVEAVGLVQHCVSTDESRFRLTCIHLAPDFIEACDNLQAMRCRFKTGLKKPLMVRGTSLMHITALAMDKVATTKSWIHFKNQDGLIFSCRKYSEEYPELDHLIDAKGHPMDIPRGLKEASERAAIFAADKPGDPTMEVRIADGKIRILGQGLSGWYKEIKEVTYSGPPIQFYISPQLLLYITDTSETNREALLCKDRLRIKGEWWDYITVLGQEPNKEKTDGARKDES